MDEKLDTLINNIRNYFQLVLFKESFNVDNIKVELKEIRPIIQKWKNDEKL